MDTRPPPLHAHTRPPSRSNDHPQYGVPASPYGDVPRNIPPPPPPSQLQQDTYYRPQRQTFERIAASTPRPDTRQAPSYPPPPPPYSGPPDAYPRDPRDALSERREGYGIKRSHDQAMAGDHVESGRPDSRRLHYDSTAPPHQQPPPPPPFSQNPQPHVTAAPPAYPNPHAPDHQKIANGTMYQAPASRSPPPPSPYGGRPMLPPGSPQYAQSPYGSHPPHGPQQGPPPLPPFGRDPGTSNHRSGMSLASILGGDPPRPPHDPRYQPMTGAPPNGHPHYGEREGQRGGPVYMPAEARSQTPDRFAPRQFDYPRPSRAHSSGERSLMADRSPEKFGFGPPLPHAHEPQIDPRGPPPLHPHNSAPGSRRQSIGGAPPPSMNRPQTSVGPGGPETFQPLSALHMDHFNHRDPRDMPREVHRPPPPPMPPLEDFRNSAHAHGPIERRYWDQDLGRPQYRDEISPPKPSNFPYMPTLPESQRPAHAIDMSRAVDQNGQAQNGHGPVFGPVAKPMGPMAEFDKRPAYDARKPSIDSIPAHYQARLESPIQKHKQVGMDRTSSTRSELTPTRSFLNVTAEERRNRAQSPMPQAVQGAQAPARGPASEPGIKNEFGRMFAGLGGVTPTRTPVELAGKRYSSPADDALGGRTTPGIGRLDMGGKRTNSGASKRRKNKDDGFDGDLESPVDIPRSVNGKGLKRSRNSYIEGLGIHRADTGSPFSGGRRAFTPTSFGLHTKRERKPKTIVRSQAVLDSVKGKPRKHLGSMLYELQVEPGKSIASYADSDNLGNDKYGFDSAPIPMPRFEDKGNCTFTVRVPREHLTKAARTEVCQRRNIWGTEVYTDDTDPLAAAIHSGWIRGEWAEDIDIGMLSIGKEKDRDGGLNSTAVGPNGSTRLSMSVSPELSRKSLAPYGNGAGNTSGSEQAASRKNSDVGSGAGDDKKAGVEIFRSVPAYPVIPGPGKDLHITLLLLPRLQQYASTVQNGIKSRPWTTQHDGNSFMVHEVQIVDEGPKGRWDGRGAGSKHARLRDRDSQARGAKRQLNNFTRTLDSRSPGVVAAVGA